MKILFVNSLYYPEVKGGAELTIKIIVEGLRHSGHECVVACLSEKKSDDIIDDINGVKVYRVVPQNRFQTINDIELTRLQRLNWKCCDIYNIASSRKLSRIVELEKPNVVFCHNLSGWSCSVWRVLQNIKVPIVQVVHDLYLLCPLSMFRNGQSCKEQCYKCKLMRLPHKFLSHRVDNVVSISRFIQNTLDDHGYFKSANKYVIHNTRNISDYYICKHDRFTVGFIGSLARHKGVELLIKEFISANIDAYLLIGGDGEISYVQYLKSLTNNRIKFLGKVRPEDFYSKIDVLVVPSLWKEALGMVAVESLAYNVPVITTGYGGLSEIVIHGKNGFIFDPNTIGSLGNNLRALYCDTHLLDTLKKNARSSVREFLDVDFMVEKYNSVIKNIDNMC